MLLFMRGLVFANPLGDRYTFANVVSQKIEPTRPGPAPELNPNDYAPYRGRGNATLVGAPFVKTDDGQTHHCTNNMDVYLYPATPYVRWMIDEYAYEVAQTGYWVEPADYVGAPTYLRAFSSDTIVRYARCGANGRFVATGLPAGTYLALLELRVIGPSANIAHSSTLYVNGAGEPVGRTDDSTTTPSWSFWDGWSVIGMDYSIPADATVLYAKADSWLTFAHEHRGHLPPSAEIPGPW